MKTRLRQARMLAKLSQVEAAREVGVSHQVISKWERGVSEPSASELGRLCATYGTSADFVLYGIATMPAVLQRIMETRREREPVRLATPPTSSVP